MTRTSVAAALAIVACTTGSALAADLQIDQVAITAGKLVIAGRTSKPNQVVVLVGTDYKTASLPSRRFSFSLAYLPETCKLQLQAEGDLSNEVVVANCAPRGRDGAIGKDGRDGKDGADGKHGNDGKDGKAGKDGQEGLVYGTLAGDGVTFRCWPSDVIGLWWIKDYPNPNSRTIAHISPDRVAGGNKMNLTEPADPLKTEAADGPAMTHWAEYDKEKLYLLNRETKARVGVRGDVAPDCRSITWRGEGDGILRTWER